MKLAFSTMSFDEYDIYGIIGICKKYGYDGIELRMDQGWGRPDLTERELTEARAALDTAGIAVICLNSSIHVLGDSPENTKTYRNLLRIASALGARGIRVMVGTHRHFKTEPLQPMDYPGTVRWMQRMCDLDPGVNLCIELHSNYCTGRIVRPLIDDVSRPNCKAIWDIMGPLSASEDLSETYAHLKGVISHVQIKDGIKDPNPASLEFIYMPLGKGTLPIFDLLKLLETNGHADMYYSLEWVECFKPELQVQALPHEQVLGGYPKFMNEMYGKLLL